MDDFGQSSEDTPLRPGPQEEAEIMVQLTPYVGHSQNNRAVALALATSGLPVFPCRPDKRPATPRGFKDATTDLYRIDRFWCECPSHLVGLPTGQSSGLFVVDLDVDRATGEPVGEKTAISKGWNYLLTLPHVSTPSGGRHVPFRHSLGLGNSVGKLGHKIDTRGEGGYIIAPGTVTPLGRYAPSSDLDLGNPPELPDALQQALLATCSGVMPCSAISLIASVDRNVKWGNAILWGELMAVATAPTGTRNDRLNRAAFAIAQASVAGGIDPQHAKTQLEAAALAAGLPICEIRKTIISGWDKGLLSPRAPKERKK